MVTEKLCIPFLVSVLPHLADFDQDDDNNEESQTANDDCDPSDS